MISRKVHVLTSTFAQHSLSPLTSLEKIGLEVQLNKTGKKLNIADHIPALLPVIGIIAGTETYSREELNKLPNLKVLSRLGVGMDNIDLKAAEENGIKVYKTTTSPAPAVAELVLGLMIDVSRHISKSNQLLKSGTWKKEMGSLLQGKTLGIIGMGTIGKALVRLASGFHFKVLAFDHHKDELFAKDNDVTYCDLESLLKDSDIVSLHLNLSDQTNEYIDAEKIKLMKPNAILINASRGEIINESDLYVALKNNQLAGAGLDVFTEEPYTGPLTELDNVALTPHIGAYASEIRIQMEIEAVENLIRGLNEL